VVGLFNNVSGSSNEFGPVIDDLCITVTPNPSFTVVKSADTLSLSAPGLVTYSYVVSNTGTVAITELVLTDDNVDAAFVGGVVDCGVQPVSIPVAGFITCTATHDFTQAEMNEAEAGTLLCPVPDGDGVVGVYNVVTAMAKEFGPVTDNLCIPVIILAPPAVLTVVKSVTAVSPLKDNTVDVTYRIDVSNSGGQSAVYDLFDMLLLGDSITPFSLIESLTYIPVSDGPVNSGVIEDVTAADYGTGVYILTGESIAEGKAEAFYVTLRFNVDVASISESASNCEFEDGELGTGFTNHVELWSDGAIADEDDACESVPAELASVPTLSQYMLALLALLMLVMGLGGVRARQRY
jgi:hypothetical protein